jgi:GNAT superfamily N-acetyltransferase
VEIRPCGVDDVERLEQAMPTGLTRSHARRFQRQRQGLGTFLVAWLCGTPVGSGEVRWDGCAAPEVRSLYPDCPELNGLHVLSELQGQGIGTALIASAEYTVRQHGGIQLGLGVDDTNTRAAALYARLGYTETGCRYLDRYHYVSPDGQRHDVADSCRFLIKPLR